MGMASTWGYALVGIDAVPVRVEAHVRPGLPGMTVVGLPGTAVREAKERIRSAAVSSGVPLPTRRITVGLSPADVRKEGPGLDLPVALAILAAAGYLLPDALRGVAAVGELALDGSVRPARGTLLCAESAEAAERTLLVLPAEGLVEASCIGSIPLLGVRSLAEALDALASSERGARLVERGRRWVRRRSASMIGRPSACEEDLAEVCGQGCAKRALEIAAAGGHHLLMHGSPGAGKTMLARRLPTIMPSMDGTEALEATRIWSASGLRSAELGLMMRRPFRSPHHTASRAALLGGGTIPRPGEVSLAHRGVLFLDELPEFSRDVLEALRQPLEEGFVTIARRDATCRFPAACSVVAAMNPCPCGYAGHPRRSCRCSQSAVERYVGRASGPLMDRIDLQVEVETPRFGAMDGPPEEPSEAVRVRVAAARSFRRLRETAARNRGLRPTAHPGGFSRWISLTSEAERLMAEAADRGLGGRGFVRVLRVARTIADLDARERVDLADVEEALAFRVSPQWAA